MIELREAARDRALATDRKIRRARDRHADALDDGETCGDVAEHKKLFNTTPNARPAAKVKAPAKRRP